MEDWSPQKMLDLYIHDYFIRNNMHETAEVFAQEADVEQKTVAITPPDGFLKEWWSIFYESYLHQTQKNLTENESLLQQAFLNFGNLPQNVHHQANLISGNVPQNVNLPQNFHPNMPRADLNSVLQNVNPALRPAGLPDLRQTVRPTMVARPDVGYTVGNPFSVPRPELNQNMFRSMSGSDHSVKPHQSITSFLAARMAEQDHLRLPGRDLNINSQLLNVEPNGRLLPSSNNRSHPQKKVCPNPQLSLTGGDMGGSSSRRPMIAAPTTRATNALQIREEPAATGRSIMTNQLPSEVCPSTARDKGKNVEMPKPGDEDVESFFSNEAPDDLSSFGTSSSPSLDKSKHPGFSLYQVVEMHPTDNKLTCCDFSSSGNFLAAAGHEKKVFIYNLKKSTMETLQGHSQLITAIRFKPTSHGFATSSFDRTVKIWDALNPGRSPMNLVGHADHVESLDFHPKRGYLLSSCDSNEEIRLWDVRVGICVQTFKGANRYLRFQPRLGQLLAAAAGNVINLINVETGKIIAHFEGHAKEILSICWDLDGKNLISTSEDSTRIWSLTSGTKSVHELHSAGNKFASCTIHPAHAQVVVVGSYQTIDIWDTRMGGRTWTSSAHKGIVSALGHSSKTGFIASVSHDKTMKLWK